MLPLDDITFNSALSAPEIMERIKNVTGTKEPCLVLFFLGEKEYQGEIFDNHFVIARNLRYKNSLGYRNSFRPIITGNIIPDRERCKIQVRFRLHWFVQIFILIWIIGVFFLFGAIFRTSGFSMELLIPICMLIFMYALTMGGFFYETNRSKADLQRIFETSPITTKPGNTI